MDFKERRIIYHCVKEVKKNKEIAVEMNRYNSNLKYNFEEISFIHPEHINLKNPLKEAEHLIKQSNYIDAKKILDVISNNFIHQNTLEYALYLKYAAKADNEHGLLNRAVSLSSKSIELFKYYVSDLHPILIETKLENYFYSSYLTYKFEIIRNGILKCLINSIIIGDKKLTVLAYYNLGISYKIFGQLNASGYYSKKSYKLYNKYRLKDIQLFKDISINLFSVLPVYQIKNSSFLRKNLPKFEKTFQDLKDHKSLGLIYYYVAQSKLNFIEYCSALDYLDKAEAQFNLVERQSKLLAMCNLIRWIALSRIGRIGFSDKYYIKSLEIMKNCYGKYNFEWILFYHEVAYNYFIMEDLDNSIKYTKMALEIINHFNSNPSAIKCTNYYLAVISMSNQEMDYTDLKNYLNGFFTSHRLIYAEESEMTVNMSVMLYMKGKYKILKEFKENQNF
jgi:hypothetical protein